MGRYWIIIVVFIRIWGAYWEQRLMRRHVRSRMLGGLGREDFGETIIFGTLQNPCAKTASSLLLYIIPNC